LPLAVTEDAGHRDLGVVIQDRLWNPAEKCERPNVAVAEGFRRRDLVKLRVQRMQDREADSERSNPFDQLQRRASAMSELGAALKGFADAGMPLYQNLSDAQKHRFSLLSHFLPTRWIAVEAKHRTKRHSKDHDSDDD
jgi:hypothetical protein